MTDWWPAALQQPPPIPMRVRPPDYMRWHNVDELESRENVARNVIAQAVSARFGWMPLSERYAAADAALAIGRAWIQGHREWLREHADEGDGFTRAEIRRQLRELESVDPEVT